MTPPPDGAADFPRCAAARGGRVTVTVRGVVRIRVSGTADESLTCEKGQ